MIFNDLRIIQTPQLDFYTVCSYGLKANTATCHANSRRKAARLEPSAVQFLYKHQNGRYYVRTFAGGKEKWTSLKTNLLSMVKNRMKEHVDAAERQRTTGNSVDAVGEPTSGDALNSGNPA